MTFYGDKTEATARAITELVRPGEEFDVHDLAVLLSGHASCFGGTAVDQADVNKTVYALSHRSDGCLERVARGRYRFHGFKQEVTTGRLCQKKFHRRPTCPTCYLELTTEGTCGYCD